MKSIIFALGLVAAQAVQLDVASETKPNFTAQALESLFEISPIIFTREDGLVTLDEAYAALNPIVGDYAGDTFDRNEGEQLMILLAKAAKLNDENAEELSMTDYIQAKAIYLEQEYNFVEA